MEIIRCEPCICLSVITKTVYIHRIVNDLHPVRTVFICISVNSAVLVGLAYALYRVAEGRVLACAQQVKCARRVGVAFLFNAPYISTVYSAHALPYRDAVVLCRCNVIFIAVNADINYLRLVLYVWVVAAWVLRHRLWILYKHKEPVVICVVFPVSCIRSLCLLVKRRAVFVCGHTRYRNYLAALLRSILDVGSN